MYQNFPTSLMADPTSSPLRGVPESSQTQGCNFTNACPPVCMLVTSMDPILLTFSDICSISSPTFHLHSNHWDISWVAPPFCKRSEQKFDHELWCICIKRRHCLICKILILASGSRFLWSSARISIAHLI